VLSPEHDLNPTSLTIEFIEQTAIAPTASRRNLVFDYSEQAIAQIDQSLISRLLRRSQMQQQAVC